MCPKSGFRLAKIGFFLPVERTCAVRLIWHYCEPARGPYAIKPFHAQAWHCCAADPVSVSVSVSVSVIQIRGYAESETQATRRRDIPARLSGKASTRLTGDSVAGKRVDRKYADILARAAIGKGCAAALEPIAYQYGPGRSAASTRPGILGFSSSFLWRPRMPSEAFEDGNI